MPSIEGSEGRLLPSLQGPEHPIALRLLLRGAEVSSEVYSLSSRLLLSLFLHLSGLPPSYPKSFVVVDEPLGSNRKCSWNKVFEERLIHLLGWRDFWHFGPETTTVDSVATARRKSFATSS